MADWEFPLIKDLVQMGIENERISRLCAEPMLTLECEKDIRAYSKLYPAHDHRVLLLGEIDRLRKENEATRDALEKYSNIELECFQLKADNEKLKTLYHAHLELQPNQTAIQNRDAAFDMLRNVLDINAELRKKIQDGKCL